MRRTSFHAIAIAAFGLPAALCASDPVRAETSSWFQTAPKTGDAANTAKPSKNRQPAPEGATNRVARGADAAPAATAGSGNSQAYIAFDQGRYLTALKLAEAAAAKGDPAAHTLIGRIYGEGFGVPQDEAAAVKWYTRGAELGDVNAMFALGLIAAEGRGVEKDRAAAAKMFEEAARKGHPEANYNLGLLFLKGDGKPENPRRAAQHIKYAAEQGVAAAQYDLSALFQKGVGVEPDAYEASRWISLAAEQGLPAAQYDYSIMLLQGNGLKKDVHKALRYMHQAADSGIAGAQNRLAYIYAEGLGVAASPVEMAKWRFVAKAGGLSDPAMDEKVSALPQEQRRAAEKAAVEWQERRQVNPLGP
ncbi:MAG: sel1 repeat family protein [Alphaproteobacteria bacterium]|nr:sel1 repeat family protein [Alphaproteobacteria bacterium]